MSEVNMPRLSDTMQEGTISHWLKKPGDEIKKGDILAEIETDKATMELEAYDAGVLERILVQEGETVPIGQAVAIIGTGAGVQKQEQPAAVRMEPEGVVAVTVPTQLAQKGETRAQKMPPETEESREGRTIKASPLARRMAEEHNIDLSEIRGTGPGGRIVRDDIEDFLEQQRRAAPVSAAPGPRPEAPPQEAPTVVAQVSMPPESEVVPLSRVQTLVANRLSESKRTIPHFYVSSEVDMTDLLSMRQAFNASAGEDGVKVTVNDLIVKACALALEKFSEVNSSFRDGQVIRYKHINVGVAVDIPSGLVVPVVRDANIKGVRTIARETKALIEKARANKLSPGDLEAGTFSVSNLGMMDVTDFIAVINPPQAAILAVSSTRKHFVPIDGQPVIRDLMTMTMSTDHRVIYGAMVARFLQEVKRLLQTPYSLLG
jgi:pyruvate dehydrogenase E2 component (dihydrolipoamide acetyltransferase)